MRFVILEYMSKILMGSEQLAFQYLEYSPKTFESRFTSMAAHKTSDQEVTLAEIKENHILKMPLFQEILNFLIQNHSSLDRLSVNSACNVISQLIRLMWLETEDHQQIISKIYQAFFEVHSDIFYSPSLPLSI